MSHIYGALIESLQSDARPNTLLIPFYKVETDTSAFSSNMNKETNQSPIEDECELEIHGLKDDVKCFDWCFARRLC